jgi:hypothetical protein
MSGNDMYQIALDDILAYVRVHLRANLYRYTDEAEKEMVRAQLYSEMPNAAIVFEPWRSLLMIVFDEVWSERRE